MSYRQIYLFPDGVAPGGMYSFNRHAIFFPLVCVVTHEALWVAQRGLRYGSSVRADGSNSSRKEKLLRTRQAINTGAF